MGNYIGAISKWIELQEEYDSYFSIVDLHAITVPQHPEELKQHIRLTAATYFACGIDPEKSTVFVQSDVPAHSQLAWIMQTMAHMGELERMTQFKDKAKKQKKGIPVGLFTYPALMAADILLYKADVVPVGDDQKQHVEFTRDIAQRFNTHVGSELLPIPEFVPPTIGTRVMGLDDPTKKMSKSASSELNYISLLDEPDVIRKKIKKAVTDSGSDIRAVAEKPAVTNLLTIFSVVIGTPIEDIEVQYEGKGYGDFKSDLAEAIVEWLVPIQTRINEYLDDPAQLDALLASGAEEANAIASQTMQEVHAAMGLGR